MSRASGLIKKADALLKRFAPPERTLYKRVVSMTGNELIGRTTATYADTLMKPQPYFHRIGRQHIPGGHAHAEDVVTASGRNLLADDYEFLISPNALSLADIQNPAVEIVAKDASGNVEVFRILDPDPIQMSGTDILYIVFARSVKR
jgi:hypothetical protein